MVGCLIVTNQRGLAKNARRGFQAIAKTHCANGQIGHQELRLNLKPRIRARKARAAIIVHQEN